MPGQVSSGQVSSGQVSSGQVSSGRPPAAARRLIVALDFHSAEKAFALVDRLEGRCRWFKVGLELYLAEGPSVVERLRSAGYDVFLDLKLHDIPNTVAAAVRTLAGSGASLLSVHAAGGPAMLQAAASAAAESTNGPRLLAVTVLTSMDAGQMQAAGVAGTPGEQVLRLGALARDCGIAGLVCSSDEVVELRRLLGYDPLLVVPGIRPRGSASGDQSRIAEPAAAVRAGASMLVVGRPITLAEDPARACEAILDEIAEAAAD